MNDYIYEFKDLPDTSTPLNAETFVAMQNKLLDSIYPIGSIMIKDDAADYSSYLGFEWEKVFAGVTLVGLDTTQTEFNTIGKKGGEKTHLLTENEIPPLNCYAAQDATGGNIAYIINYDGYNGNNIGDVPIAKTKETLNIAHNNLQPYQVVAYWKRVA